MRIRLRNRVVEVHKQLIKFLVINYDLVLLPSFETSQMVVKVGRKIRSQTVRSMLTWSHYRFKQILEEYASVGDFSFPNFGTYPLQSSACCTETEMSSLDFDILESLDHFR